MMVKKSKRYGTICMLMALGVSLLLLGCPQSGPAPKAEKAAQKKPSLSPEAMEHFRQGHKFLAEQKLDEALKEFQEAVRLSPEAPIAHFWLGKVYSFRKDRDQADKALKKVLELDPENAYALATLGRLYSLDKDNLPKAQEYLQKALEFSPDNLEAHFDLGRVYAMQGERQKAVQEFGFLFSKEAEFFIYHFEMGRILEAWGEKDKALNQYQRALYLNPKFEAASQAIKRLEGKETVATQPSKTESPTPASKR